MVVIDNAMAANFIAGAVLALVSVSVWKSGGGDRGWANYLGGVLGFCCMGSYLLLLFGAIHHSLIGWIVLTYVVTAQQNLGVYEIVGFVGFAVGLIGHHFHTEGTPW